MKHQLTILLFGEVSKSFRGTLFPTHALKSAPHYFEKTVPHQVMLKEEAVKVGGEKITFLLKGYPPEILLIQTSIPVTNIFHTDIFSLEEKVLEQAYKIFDRMGGKREFSEIYSVFTVSNYTENPEIFTEKHAPIIASLLKSERFELDPKEVEYTLSNQIKYAKNDLAIIDWDGAFLFDPEGDFEPTIELLSIANLQLLRHRILDREIDERIEKMVKMVKTPRKKFSLFKFSNKIINHQLEEILKYRMASISAFQAIEREIKLIGDWYSARLYDLAAKKFKIDEWRKSIKDKLESLEDAYTSLTENFGLSRKDRAEYVQIIAFFVLQIGWLVLIILEFLYFTR
ncbi:MAG: hypothetical protein AAB432_02945 [Patescibacteria group bacterium]